MVIGRPAAVFLARGGRRRLRRRRRRHLAAWSRCGGLDVACPPRLALCDNVFFLLWGAAAAAVAVLLAASPPGTGLGLVTLPAAIRVLVVACALLAPALAAVAERATGLDRRL